MIKVKYENEESGQTAVFTIKPADDESANVKMDFDPVIKDETEDPYGILNQLLAVSGVGGKG